MTYRTALVTVAVAMLIVAVGGALHAGAEPGTLRFDVGTLLVALGGLSAIASLLSGILGARRRRDRDGVERPIIYTSQRDRW